MFDFQELNLRGISFIRVQGIVAFEEEVSQSLGKRLST